MDRFCPIFFFFFKQVATLRSDIIFFFISLTLVFFFIQGRSTTLTSSAPIEGAVTSDAVTAGTLF